MSHPFTLTLSCQERPGIVHAVSSFLFEHGCDIVEHQQFDDPLRGQLFARTAFVCAEDTDADRLSAAFRVVADRFGMTYQVAGEEHLEVLVTGDLFDARLLRGALVVTERQEHQLP